MDGPIRIDPEIMHGTPCFVSTRVPVKTLFELLARSDARLLRRAVPLRASGAGRGRARDGRRSFAHFGKRDGGVKVPLGECAAKDFRRDIVGHDVYTAGFLGWAGVKNGRLLATAAAAGFDVMVTTDREFEHQQNLAAHPLSVVLLRPATNDLADLRPLVPDLLRTLAVLPPMSFAVVDGS
jgi:hypothetical protein